VGCSKKSFPGSMPTEVHESLYSITWIDPFALFYYVLVIFPPKNATFFVLNLKSRDCFDYKINKPISHTCRYRCCNSDDDLIHSHEHCKKWPGLCISILLSRTQLLGDIEIHFNVRWSMDHGEVCAVLYCLF